MNKIRATYCFKTSIIAISSILLVAVHPSNIVFAETGVSPVITIGQEGRLGDFSNIEGIEDLTGNIRDNDMLADQIEESEDLMTDNISESEVIETVLDVSDEDVTSKDRVYLGRFKVTHYCPCSKCNGKFKGTASGRSMKIGTTIAVDPDVIPLGSYVEIGNHVYRADDTGGAIKRNRIDILAASHKEALRLGTYTTDVYLVR